MEKEVSCFYWTPFITSLGEKCSCEQVSAPPAFHQLVILTEKGSFSGRQRFAAAGGMVYGKGLAAPGTAIIYEG